MSQTHHAPLYRNMFIVGGTDEEPIFDLVLVARAILQSSENQSAREKLLLDFIINMYTLRMLDSVDIGGFQHALSDNDLRLGLIADIMSKNIFFGTAGDDNLTGTTGNDAFVNITGNNTLNGGHGEDIFIFRDSSGTNTIINSGGTYTIMLPDVAHSDFSISKTHNSRNGIDIEITFSGSSGRILIPNFSHMIDSNFIFVFSDGSIINMLDHYIDHQVVDISTAADLGRIQENLNGVYRLTADLDFSDVEHAPIGSSAMPFRGILDGNGHSIKNLTINLPSQNQVGLFSSNAGLIKNLVIENSNISGSVNTGVIAGQNIGVIKDSAATNIDGLSGRVSTGGLVGNNTGIISRSHSTGSTLTGENQVGGFVGLNSGRILESYTTINVHGRNNVGGFVGNSTSGSLIERSYATGDVTSGNRAGGFIGSAEGTSIVRNSFAMGNVSGPVAGGFVANASNIARMENCYSLASHPNGFNGNNVTMINCFFDRDRISRTTTKVQGRTTEEMQQQSTFIDWDFETIWEISEGEYPLLQGLDKPVRGYLAITTADELNSIRDNLDGTYRLEADIDLSGIDWLPIGTFASPFSGTFDGNGYSITNLSINLPDQNHIGLFGSNNGTIKNLKIENSNIAGSVNTGVIAGLNSGSIMYSAATDIIRLVGIGSTGGLVGSNSGVIRESFSTGSEIIGINLVGGLVGSNSGTILRSFTTLNVQGRNHVGGFVGNSTSGSLIEQSHATGDVRSTDRAGGFIGSANGTTVIRNSFAMGNVSSTIAGGFVSSGTTMALIENSYSLADHPNGFNGSIVTMVNCFFDRDLSSSTKEQGRTTAEMLQQSTFEGWDFETIWIILDGQYPTLRGLPNFTNRIPELSDMLVDLEEKSETALELEEEPDTDLEVDTEPESSPETDDIEDEVNDEVHEMAPSSDEDANLELEPEQEE